MVFSNSGRDNPYEKYLLLPSKIALHVYAYIIFVILQVYTGDFKIGKAELLSGPEKDRFVFELEL